MTDQTWTVMVFMGAHNLEREPDLTDEADDDLAEMQRARSGPRVNIVVHIDRRSGPSRFFIEPDGTRREFPVAPGRGSTGDGAVLVEFLLFCLKEFPAKHYLLVLWGHAYRLAFGRDGADAMEFPKLSQALEGFKKANRNEKLDVVGFDACGMCVFEGAYQLRHTAGYMIASQVGVPLPGWPYEIILERMNADPDMTATDVGALIVRKFVGSYDEQGVTMSMLDLQRSAVIASAVAELTGELRRALTADALELVNVEEIFQDCHVVKDQAAVDLVTFCWHLVTYSEHEGIRRAARKVGDLLINPGESFIREHGRSNITVALLQGLSLFAPMVGPAKDLPELRQRYDALDFASETGWGDLVFELAQL